MKKYSKLIVAAIVALIFVGTFVFLYQKSQPKATEYSEFVPKMGDVLKTTVITGKIEPRNEVSVKPQISGIITEICKEAGDYVQAGEVIAKVKVIPDMGQLSSAQARVRLAEINLKQAQVDFGREDNLYKKQLVSADEFDKVKQALKQAREERWLPKMLSKLYVMVCRRVMPMPLLPSYVPLSRVLFSIFLSRWATRSFFPIPSMTVLP